MNIRQLTVEEARLILDSEPGAVYIDVRTPEEFDRGRPSGALNIPVVFPDPSTRQMAPNPDFLAVVAKHVPKTTRVILGCQMGGRSQFAAETLARSGYLDVSNMQGGFGGARNPMGQVEVPGWTQLGYPVETGAPARTSWDELRK